MSETINRLYKWSTIWIRSGCQAFLWAILFKFSNTHCWLWTCVRENTFQHILRVSSAHMVRTGNTPWAGYITHYSHLHSMLNAFWSVRGKTPGKIHACCCSVCMCKSVTYQTFLQRWPRRWPHSLNLVPADWMPVPQCPSLPASLHPPPPLLARRETLGG